jgi:hypothetical protein
VLRTRGGATTTLSFGHASDRGVAGDWDGEGRWEIGRWRPSDATFRLRKQDGSTRTVRLGSVGSLPVTGDWNGDGRTDVGVYTAGTWTLQVLRRGHLGWTGTVRFGGSAALPVVGDWNGDGATDLGTWNPQDALFTLRKTAPKSLAAGELLTRRWGRHR